MASLEQQASGNYTLRFYFGKRKFNRSLHTTELKTALTLQAQAEETIRLLKRGVWKLPPDATYDDAGEFIASGGQRLSKPSVGATMTLAETKKAYFDSIPEGAKEGTSLATERTHLRHFVRLLKGSTPIQAIREPELQSKFINKRTREKGQNGKTVQPDTIRKEIQTFFQLRDFAKAQGWVVGDLDRKHLKYPKPDDKPPFTTWKKIEARIERGGLNQQQIEELWDCLFLEEKEVLELVKSVEENAEQDFIVPMFAIAAFTGARRSEILRSQIEDFPLDGSPCFVREKKRKKNVSVSFRQVPLFPPLKNILQKWLKKHPGGNYIICTPPNVVRSRNKSDSPKPLSKDQANYYFEKTLDETKWSNIRGFHTLRHSFASICAMKGVPQGVVDSWMGHQTEQMRARYRHLFPDEATQAASKVFVAGGLFARSR